MDKSKIYLDLTNCTEEERIILTKIKELDIDLSYRYLFFDGESWDQCRSERLLKDKTELLYPEFIKLFEGGERKEVLQVENNGWIKIEGIANEIKESGDLWVVNKYGAIEFLQELEYLPIGYATHYQPIIKPLPPKF